MVGAVLIIAAATLILHVVIALLLRRQRGNYSTSAKRRHAQYSSLTTTYSMYAVHIQKWDGGCSWICCYSSRTLQDLRRNLRVRNTLKNNIIMMKIHAMHVCLFLRIPFQTTSNEAYNVVRGTGRTSAVDYEVPQNHPPPTWSSRPAAGDNFYEHAWHWHSVCKNDVVAEVLLFVFTP